MTTFLQPYFWTTGQSSRSYPIRWAPVLVTPSANVVTLADAKLHAHISADTENAGITEWIRTAQEQVEQDTDLKLLTQTWDLAGDHVPYGGVPIILPFGPVQSVTHVKSYDSTATLQTLASSNYVVDTFSRPGRIGQTDTGLWPTDLRLFQPLVIRAVFGWTSAALVPAPLLHAMRLLIAHYSEQREAVVVNIGNVTALPLGYEALIAPFRPCVLA